MFSAVVPCLSEMTAVMSCWKVNSFDDVPCRKEIQDFVACAEKAVSRIQLKFIYIILLAFCYDHTNQSSAVSRPMEIVKCWHWLIILM